MYTDGVRLLALRILEKDIVACSKKYHISGFDEEDLAQELRAYVWEGMKYYNPYKSSIRTWGNLFIHCTIKNLYVAQEKTDKRKANAIKTFLPDDEILGLVLYQKDDRNASYIDIDAIEDEFYKPLLDIYYKSLYMFLVYYIDEETKDKNFRQNTTVSRRVRKMAQDTTALSYR